MEQQIGGFKERANKRVLNRLNYAAGFTFRMESRMESLPNGVEEG